MSRFFSKKYSSLEAYVPGEQPRDMKYIKLNTNESPYPVSEKVSLSVKESAKRLNLYSDPECAGLREKASEVFGVKMERLLMTNGSDEALNFAFMAFCDDEHPIVFPDITYGFYPVFAQLNSIPYEQIPLDENLKIRAENYEAINKNIVIANPNAPTGICLLLEQIETIAKTNPNNVVIVDEAYVDFGAESAIPLTEKYDNLLVVGTFSKSRSMAGARLGFAIGNEELINDLNTIKYSTNPYNVNTMTAAAGVAVLDENDRYISFCEEIAKTRAFTKKELEKLGFFVTDSKANFLFAKSDRISGEKLYLELKKQGVLIRHFKTERIKDFNRITIGTKEQMKVFLEKVENILRES